MNKGLGSSENHLMVSSDSIDLKLVKNPSTDNSIASIKPIISPELQKARKNRMSVFAQNKINLNDLKG